jgi:hypothetical protein
MKTAYFLVAFLALSVASWAGDEGFKSSRARSAMRQYDAEVEKAKQEATRKIEAARKKYQATLDREVRTATRRGDLDEANKLNAEKKKVQMPVTVEVVADTTAVTESTVADLNLLERDWLYSWGKKGGQNKKTKFSRDGTVTAGKVAGTWRKEGDTLIIKWGERVTDQIKVVKGELVGKNNKGEKVQLIAAP